MFAKTRILLASAALLALFGCSSNDAMQGAVPAAGTVAATVNGTPISEGLVDMMLQQRSDLGRQISPEARKAFIDRLAMQLVITQEAVKKGLDKKPEVVNRIELGRQSALVDAFIQDFLKTNVVTDDALKAEYEKYKTEAAGMEYKARHILVETEDEAKRIIASLKKDPKAFDALAKKQSKDDGSKIRGGDLGWFDPRAMVPEFGTAVSALTKGKFSETPVKSQFGYHVILLEDSRAKTPQPLEQIKQQLVQHMNEQNLRKLFDELKSKAKIEIAGVPAAAQPAKPEPSGSK